jgi:hypothetical protein
MSDTFTLLTPEGKGIIGQVDANGVLTFAVEAGPACSIRGTELFNRMMQHFGGRVQSIHGVWRKGTPNQPSTNIDKVNELTAQGMALNDAIRHAWTVTRAFKWGFTRVWVFGTPVGRPGNYSEIDVLIEK